MLNQPKKMHAEVQKNCWNDRFYKKRGESATSFYNGEISNYSILPLSNRITNMQTIPSQYP
jgi:hypothetical protein